MFRDKVVRGGPKQDLFRKEFRGVPFLARIRTSALRVEEESNLAPRATSSAKDAKLACDLPGYDHDCAYFKDCDKTSSSCKWRAVLSES